MLDCQYIKGIDLVSRDIAGETIIVPIKGHVGDLNNIYSLNEAGSIIWGLIDGRRRVEGIIKETCEEFEVSQGEAERDVLDFLGSLRDAGLIRPVDTEERLVNDVT